MELPASGKWGKWVGWLVALAVLTVPHIAAMQTIFQFPPPSTDPPSDPQAPVITSPKPNITRKIDTSNMTLHGWSGKNRHQLVLSQKRVEGNETENVYASGRVFYRYPVQFLRKTPCDMYRATPFNTMFQVRIEVSKSDASHGAIPGLAFIIARDSSAEKGADGKYLGWLNSSSNGRSRGNFAVEVDFVKDAEFDDLGVVHVGVNMNSLNSTASMPLLLLKKALTSGRDVQIDVTVWISFNGCHLEVYISDPVRVPNSTAHPEPIAVNRPSMPVLRTIGRLSELLKTQSYIGFSGSLKSESAKYTIYQWTFNSDGPAPDYPRYSNGTVDKDPGAEARAHEEAKRRKEKEMRIERIIIICASAIPGALLAVFLAFVIFVLLKRNARLNALAKKYQLEELELLGRGPQSFKYQALSAATKGFSPKQLLGTGGFGSVYKGQIRLTGAKSQTTVAVKRISATSHQGASEFLAEVKIIGQVQHRNLLRVLGWCHERGELLLVYDYMPNGSLDQHLYNSREENKEGDVLAWDWRLKIVGGVALALAYLHEEWEQRVIHRDVKSSNVMLDADFNARLGDFGLARLSAHGQAPPSTAVLAGTHGYLAPELGHTLKATEKTDVYSFGAVVLEVATGKRPILSRDDQKALGEILLLDWVWALYGDGKILEAADSRLRGEWNDGQMATLLKIGLLCSHPDPNGRPSMRHVLNIWTGLTSFPFLPHRKPVPTFRRGASTIRKDFESDVESRATIDTEEKDHTLMSSMLDSSTSQLDYYSREELRFTPTTLESTISSPGLRCRSWKTQPLPL